MVVEFLTRLRFLWRRKSRSEIDDELQFHLEELIQKNIASGMPPEEAHRQARIAFGGLETSREACHEARPGWLFETVLQDIRYGLRGYYRNPIFALTVVLTLALGIGATTAVFSVVDRILFRPLPYKGGDRLVSVGLTAPILPQEFLLGDSYYDWRDHQTPFESLTSETGVEPCDLTEQRPARLDCAHVEANFLETLGVAPLLGRSFTREEDRPNVPQVALISYGLWKRDFGLDHGILNKTISIDGKPVRVIGVLPRNFEMPLLEATDVMLPEALDETAQRKGGPAARVMYAFARLKPGVTIDQAKAALKPVFDYSLSQAPPRFRQEVHLRVRSLRDRQIYNVRLIAWVLLGTVITMLLIACANVASLMMARGMARARELAVRSALGASRTRLSRQTVTEALLLVLAGAIVGCGLAEVLLHIFIAVAPEGIPFLDKAQLDLRIIGFTLVVSLLCGVLFGLAPALQRPRAESLAGRSIGIVSRAGLRQWLVVTQIAASMILLSGGMLLLRSFWNLQNQNLGIRTQSILTAGISLGHQHYATPEQQMRFFLDLRARLQHLPGVTALSFSDSLPPGGMRSDQPYTTIAIEGRPAPTGGTGGMVTRRWVTPGYFRALGIPILQGEGFREDELNSKDHFAVLSKTLAARIFPQGNAIGKRIQPILSGPWYLVVGVVQDVKNGGLSGSDEPEYYRLRRNYAEDWNEYSEVIVKTSASPDAMAQWMHSEIADLDPTIPVKIETLQQQVGKMADQPRFEASLVGFFAVTGLLLSVIGLYGVISFLVMQRTQEFGVRMAMGAKRSDILKLVAGKALKLVLLGGGLGLIAAMGSTHLFSSLLFGLRPYDPISFIGITVLVLVVALSATLIPARLATKINPTVALREE